MAKYTNTRIRHKNDSLQNWKSATGFIPEVGEFFLVNDYDFPIIFGDGKTSAAVLSEKPLLRKITNEEISSLFTQKEE